MKTLHSSEEPKRRHIKIATAFPEQNSFQKVKVHHFIEKELFPKKLHNAEKLSSLVRSFAQILTKLSSVPQD